VNTNRWSAAFTDIYAGGATQVPSTRKWTAPTAPTAGGFETKEFWGKGYNSNYAATWHFVRGDPVATDGYSSGAKTPQDGDGPLSSKHLEQTSAAPSTIAMLGDAREGSRSDAGLDTHARVDALNTFAGKEIVSLNDFSVESFCDGMNATATLFGAGAKAQEFLDIQPLHRMKSDLTGGYTNMLFADGHVTAVYDRNGSGGAPDGYIGAYKVGSTVTLDEAAYDEIAGTAYVRRLRPLSNGAGGVVE